jgi:hypothetical protein
VRTLRIRKVEKIPAVSHRKVLLAKNVLASMPDIRDDRWCTLLKLADCAAPAWRCRGIQQKPAAARRSVLAKFSY